MSDQRHPDHSAIKAGQLESLRTLLAELIPGNRFYTRKLQDAGLGFDVSSLGDFSSRFPFTSKDELVRDQEAHPPFGTNLTYPLNCYTRLHQTSGTMGKPLRWLDTPESWDWGLENWMEVFRAAGVNQADRVFFPFSFGPFIGFWMAFESAERLGCLCIPGGGLNSVARLHTIMDNQATVLCCTPTYAMRLGEVAEQADIDLSKSSVRVVILAGEPGGSIPSTRNKIQSLWRTARLFDHHGMTEVGPVTYECPAQPGRLHVIERGHFAEVIDSDSGKPVSDGQEGELILTTLGRTGSPLLRYRTGDLVRPKTGACECGRHELALEGGILGRVDDMVFVRGVNVHPSAVEGIVRSIDGIAEYRMHLTARDSMTELELAIEPSPECQNHQLLVSQIRQAFETNLALRVPVQIVPINSLPRFEMKAKRWVRE